MKNHNVAHNISALLIITLFGWGILIIYLQQDTSILAIATAVAAIMMRLEK